MTFYQVKDGRIIRELPADRMAVEATDDGVRYVYYETRGIRCAAKSELGDWCSRDAGHRGAHESRDPKGRGLVGWWNEEYLR
jgi:hypothetical protein